MVIYDHSEKSGGILRGLEKIPPPARGTRPNKNNKCNCTLVKSDSKNVRLIWKKVKCGANCNKNWSKSTKYASYASGR